MRSLLILPFSVWLITAHAQRAEITMNGVRAFALLAHMAFSMIMAAQPGSPDIGFTLVSDIKGRRMAGFHAEDVLTRHDMEWRGMESWSVEEHFTTQSPYEPERYGEHTWWMLTGTPLTGPGRHRLQFRFMDCWCTEHYILVQRGTESMRIDLPDASADRWALAQHVMARSGNIASPEMIRYRPGRFTFAELMNDTVFDELEMRLAKRLRDAANASYQKQLVELEEYYRTHPPPPAPTPLTPPPLTQEKWLAEMAKQPGLKKVEVDRMNADTVRVRITGRVMLDGGCASGMPLFGVEMQTDTGWEERIPLELVQMDCGMPWADWDQHVVMMPPLFWWVGAHQPEGFKALTPGTYRLVFAGGNMKQVRTEAFEMVLDP